MYSGFGWWHLITLYSLKTELYTHSSLSGIIVLKVISKCNFENKQTFPLTTVEAFISQVACSTWTCFRENLTVLFLVNISNRGIFVLDVSKYPSSGTPSEYIQDLMIGAIWLVTCYHTIMSIHPFLLKWNPSS